MSKLSSLTLGTGIALVSMFAAVPAFAQVAPGTESASASADATDAAPASAPQAQGPAGPMSQEELRAQLNARFPAGVYIPNPGDTGLTTPPRFYRAGDMVTRGVQLPNGVVVKYSMEELGSAVRTDISACNAGGRYKARTNELDQRRVDNAVKEEKRYKNGQTIGTVAHVGGAVGTVGTAALMFGTPYALVTAPMAVVGLIDHFINAGDRKTAHENNVMFADVLGLDLDMRRGWVEVMSGDIDGNGVEGGWCGAFRASELQNGNAYAAPEPAPEPLDKKKKKHK